MRSRVIRLLIVDDSALARRVIADSLLPFPEIQVVGTAMDPYVARDKIRELAPDVLTLDLDMPRMDGLTFLKLLMKHRPMPVIIMSSLTMAGSQKAMEALAAGAVDVIDKPSGSDSAYSDGARLAQKIFAAAEARISSHAFDTPESSRPALPVMKGVVANLSRASSKPSSPRDIILIGASTGGTEALTVVLTHLKPDLPGICIVQHIPAHFSAAFAARMDRVCRIEVREAKVGDLVTPGLALIAPGGYHMLLRWIGSRYVVDLNEGPPLHHQRPAVDVLFDSGNKAGAGPHSIAVLLTGMGTDGAAGLLRLRQAGAITIAQNEETCVVFGMPREAIRLGAAQHILPLRQIGPALEILHSRLATAA